MHQSLLLCVSSHSAYVCEPTEKKIFLRQAFENILPEEVLHRSKQGFGVPVTKWLQGPLVNQLKIYLPSPLFERNPQIVLLKHFQHDASSNARRVWMLFVFAIWAEQFKATW